MGRDNSPYDEGLISQEREDPLNHYLASLSTPSLNQFADKVPKAEALGVEITCINSGLARNSQLAIDVTSMRIRKRKLQTCRRVIDHARIRNGRSTGHFVLLESLTPFGGMAGDRFDVKDAIAVFECASHDSLHNRLTLVVPMLNGTADFEKK